LSLNLKSGRGRFTPWDRDPLAEPEERRSSLLDVAPVGMFEVDVGGECTYVNSRWCELTGMPPGAARERGWERSLHPADRERVLRRWGETVAKGGEFTAECRLRRSSGEDVWVTARAVALRDPDGEITGYLVTATDISEQKRVQHHFETLAYTDDLTGLANRRAAMAAMDGHLDGASHNGWLGALMLIDVDRLKAVNDQHGHDAGDRALIGMAHVMRAALGPDDVLGRIGGDEFVLLQPSADAKAATEAARSILEAVSSLGSSEPASTTVSIGVALVGPGTTRTDLLTRADQALYLAKQRGGGNFAVYGSSMGAPDPIRA
jgi:diguanylate cyclase (GGDEF)-like protein/PAS domain S-box-containing protein